MLKRIFASLLILTILTIFGCASSSPQASATTPSGHEELEAVIGMHKADALEKLGMSESDLTAHEYQPNVYNTTRKTTFAGVEFAVSFGIFPDDLISDVYYRAIYDGDISTFAKDVHTVANELEKNLTDDNLIKDIPLSDLEAAYAKGRMEEDNIDITDTAPKNVRDYMEFMMSTDYWKEFHQLNENIPIPAGYVCKFTASCIEPESKKAIIEIRYRVTRRPANYSYQVESDQNN